MLSLQFSHAYISCFCPGSPFCRQPCLCLKCNIKMQLYLRTTKTTTCTPAARLRSRWDITVHSRWADKIPSSSAVSLPQSAPVQSLLCSSPESLLKSGPLFLTACLDSTFKTFHTIHYVSANSFSKISFPINSIRNFRTSLYFILDIANIQSQCTANSLLLGFSHPHSAIMLFLFQELFISLSF